MIESRPVAPTALAIARQGAFFVGGDYRESRDGRVMVGQMFVQYQIPAACLQPYPIVMLHGGGQTGMNFLATPDGRPGWADAFLEHGYAVYVADQPARGRSSGSVEHLGVPVPRCAEAIERRFTAPEKYRLYPGAERHTQWPGTGEPGDPVFDQFYASQVEQLDDPAIGERLTRAAGAALLDRIGPAILLTHSQGGPLGWTIADARPQLVRGIVAVEPNGPPVYEADFVGGEAWWRDGPLARPWGITRGPLTYDPPVEQAAALRFRTEPEPEHPDLVRCREQADPPRKLAHLQGIPILIVTAEASYHAPYDHCTARYLAQAGVANTFVRLADVGLRGNGHMMMLERNSRAIADFLAGWLTANVR